MRQGIGFSWQAVIAGTVASAMVYVVLNVLWMAIGFSPPMRSMLQVNAGVIGTRFDAGDGVLLLIFGILSLFSGGYLAGRMVFSNTRAQGVVQGLLVASLFFLFSFSPLSGMGLAPPLTGPAGLVRAPRVIGTGVGPLVTFLASLGQETAARSEINEAIVLALKGNFYRDALPSVASRLVLSFVRKDMDAARRILLDEGVDTGVLDRRLMSAYQAYLTTGRSIETSTHRSVSLTSWTLLMTLLIGTAFAAVGGLLGVRTPELGVRTEPEQISRAA